MSRVLIEQVENGNQYLHAARDQFDDALREIYDAQETVRVADDDFNAEADYDELSEADYGDNADEAQELLMRLEEVRESYRASVEDMGRAIDAAEGKASEAYERLCEAIRFHDDADANSSDIEAYYSEAVDIGIKLEELMAS